MARNFVSFTIIAFLLFFGTDTIRATHDEGWGQGPEMPVPLGEVGAAIVDEVLYVAGWQSAQVMAFDLASETWAPANAVAPRPHLGHHHAAQALGGKLYIIGGAQGGAEGKLQIYDPTTNQWSLGADLPYAGSSIATCEIEGEIYAAGGQVSGRGSVSDVAKYNATSNTWTTLASMPHGHNHAAGGTDGERFWVFGGRGGGSGTTVQVYDPGNNEWESSHLPDGTLAPLPLGRAGMGNAPYLLGEFYVLGGEGGTPQLHDRVDIYNPVSNSWRLGTPMPLARHGISPLASGGRIYVAGGGEIAFAFAQTATLQILGVPDSFDDWRIRQFTADDLANPEKEITHWGANADLDNDGLETLLEYLMNLDPRRRDTHDAIEATFLPGQKSIILRYRKSKNAPDGALSAEASTELVNWSRNGVTDTIIANLGAAWLVEAVVDASEMTRIFVRLSGEVNNEVP